MPPNSEGVEAPKASKVQPSRSLYFFYVCLAFGPGPLVLGSEGPKCRWRQSQYSVPTHALYDMTGHCQVPAMGTRRGDLR